MAATAHASRELEPKGLDTLAGISHRFSRICRSLRVILPRGSRPAFFGLSTSPRAYSSTPTSRQRTTVQYLEAKTCRNPQSIQTS